ncbi:MAG: hypothetical protein ABF546_12610 [Lentilactobacillus hilgardii]|nr:hypothetical protein [Lentilactobacillus hilgardii]EEI72151.1 hypothetical protein HMPREF0496_0597 [Lentilactobacillus hilgardii ATCC 27305]
MQVSFYTYLFNLTPSDFLIALESRKGLLVNEETALAGRLGT